MIAQLEGLLFLCGDEGITTHDIKSILNLNDHNLQNLISSLKKDYENQERGLNLEVYGDICKLVTKKEHAEVYSKLVELEVSRPLSQSSLEVLAIIAYNQPITRSRVDEVRGIGSAHILRRLTSKNLIEEFGRSELPGRPILYKTTSKFLDSLGIKNLEELPKIDELEENSEEKDLFSSKYTEL